MLQKLRCSGSELDSFLRVSARTKDFLSVDTKEPRVKKLPHSTTFLTTMQADFLLLAPLSLSVMYEDHESRRGADTCQSETKALIYQEFADL